MHKCMWKATQSSVFIHCKCGKGMAVALHWIICNELSWYQTTRKTEMETLRKTLSVQSLTLPQHAQKHVKGNAIYCVYPLQVWKGDGSCTAWNHLQWSCHGIKQPGRQRWKLCVKTLSVQSLTLLQHAQKHVKGNAIHCVYPPQRRKGDGSCTVLNHLQWSCHGIKQPGRKRWKLCVRRFKCNVILDFLCQKNFKGEFWLIALISRANKMNNCLHSVRSLTCWPTDKSSQKFHAQMATKSPSFAKSSSTDFATS